MDRFFRRCLVLGLAACGLLGGCYSLPRLTNPGTEEYQRSRANLHDPYADKDLGPEVVGGRPREFDQPLAQPVRETLLRRSWWAR